MNVPIPIERQNLPALPDNPTALPAARLAEVCAEVYRRREEVVGAASLEAASEMLRRAKAIEQYVAGKEQKAAARRAARILETAVGEALGSAEMGRPAAGEKLPREVTSIGHQDRHRFRLMAAHRAEWWPELEKRPLSRSQVLASIQSSSCKARATDAKTARPAGRKVADLQMLVGRGEKFGCIYADPPWVYDNQGTRAATGNHYDGLTVEELCALPVRELAADDAHLHLWTTNGFLFDCPRIFEAWGFEFRSSFVWVKPQMGIGNYWRNSHEFLLTAIRGKAKRFNDRSIMSWLECDRGRHSAKPEQVRSFIERASPGPFLEMFARTGAPGWTVFGNQLPETLLCYDMEAVA